MCASLMVVREVAGQDAAQVPFTEDGNGILPWAVRGREDFLDPQVRHAAPKRLAVDLVAVVEERGWGESSGKACPICWAVQWAVERLVEGVQKGVHRLCSPSNLPIPGPARADRRAVRRCPKLYRTRLRPAMAVTCNSA